MKLRKVPANFHLRMSLTVIKVIGTWPPLGKYRYLYFVYTVCIFMLMVGFLMMSEIANLIVNWGDMKKMLAGVTLFMTNCVHTFKVVVVLCRQKRIRGLLDMTRSELFNQDNEKYENVVQEYTWQGMSHYITYQSLGFITCLLWEIQSAANALSGRLRELPTEGWYPYNATITPVFEITLIHQCLSLGLSCFHDIATDALIIGFIVVANCQLTVLNQNLRSLNNTQDKGICKDPDSPDSSDSPDSPDRIYNNLRKCVEHSNMIFDYTNEIQNVFGSSIFLQFFVNCIIICFVAFNIVVMKTFIPSVMMSLVIQLLVMIIQIFIYCWHGNELYLHSTDTPLAAYSCKWWHGEKSLKEGLKIIIARTQHPISLKAGSVMTLSLETFISILKMSYSVFTVLRGAAE